MIDQFWIAIGVKPDTSGTKQIKKDAEDAKQSLLSLGTAVKAALGGLVLRSIASVGDQFERNQNIIAGFLTSLGFAGDFNAGLKLADETMQSINAAAAKLPGEAQEYVEVFRAGLPVLKGALPGASLSALTEFSNTFTAIGKSLDVDAAQIGRDLSLILGPTGRAGAQVLTFQRMLPLLQQLDGQAKLNAESFNKMTQPERLKLLQQAMSSPGMQAMLMRSATSFDAMAGAAKSMVTTLLRKSTVGLFEGMKKGLDEVRALFIDDKGEMTALAREFADAGKQISRVIVQVVSMLGGMATWLIKNEAAMKVMKGALIAVGIALSALALQQTVGWLGKMFTAVFNLKKLLLGGLLVALVLIAEDIYTFIQGGESVTGILLKEFPIATKIAIAAIAALGAAFITAKTIAVAQLIPNIIRLGTISAAMGAQSAAAWVAAAAPFLAIGAAIGVALVAGYKLAEFLDQKFDIVNKFANAVADITGIPRTTESAALKNFKSSPNFKKYDPDGPPAFLSKPLPKAAPLPTWTPNMSFSGSGNTDGVTAPQAGPTVNIGDVTIKSDNPRDAGRAFMNTVRDAQSKVSH